MRQLPVALFTLSLVGWSTTADAQLPNGLVFDDPYTASFEACAITAR